MKLLAVNYHYFRELKYDSGIYPLSKAALNKQIDELSRHYQFVSQSDIVNWIERGLYPNGNFCIITMDDGLKEQKSPFEWLIEKGIPSILYVPVKPVKEKKVLPVHQLHYLRTKTSDDELFDILDATYKLGSIEFDETAISAQYRYDRLKAQKVKYYLNFILNEKERSNIIQELFRKLVSDEKTFANNLYFDESDLKVISGLGCLGAHGFAHIPLAQTTLITARQDIHDSVIWLEEVTKQPIYSFSYPYGSKTAVNDSLATLFKGTQICFAFTMWRGWNTKDQLARPLFLNRVDTNDAPGGKNLSIQFIPDH